MSHIQEDLSRLARSSNLTGICVRAVLTDTGRLKDTDICTFSIATWHPWQLQPSCGTERSFDVGCIGAKRLMLEASLDSMVTLDYVKFVDISTACQSSCTVIDSKASSC